MQSKGITLAATLRGRFLSTVAFPSAHALVRVGCVPYDAFMTAHAVTSAQVGRAMERMSEHDSFDDIDWPAKLPRPRMSEVVRQMRLGMFEPDGDMVARFCSVMEITPEQLVRPRSAAPADRGIVEAAVLFMQELDYDDYEFHRLRLFLAGEVNKARRTADTIYAPAMRTNRMMLEEAETFWMREDGAVHEIGDLLPPIEQNRHDIDARIALYTAFLEDVAHERPLYRAGRNAQRQERAERAAAALTLYRDWSVDKNTMEFLGAEAASRHILSEFSIDDLGLRAGVPPAAGMGKPRP